MRLLFNYDLGAHYIIGYIETNAYCLMNKEENILN